jgi:glycosyltransferase involved in cell wall biosynthesis
VLFPPSYFMPELSVIVPVYRTAPTHLSESIKSLLVATPSDSEIHIGLDGPSDEAIYKTIENIRKTNTSKRVIRVSLFERQGLTKTLNALIGKCDCTYVARHDSDDVCLPGRLQMQLEAMDRYREYGFCGTQIVRCDEDLTPYKHQRRYPRSFKSQLIYASLLNNPIAHPSLLIKREILEAATYHEIAGAEDWDLYIRLWEAGYMSFNLNKEGLLYRVHSQQITKRQRNRVLLNQLKAQSLDAATRHFYGIRILKPLQLIGNASRFSEIAINAKKWLDQ